MKDFKKVSFDGDRYLMAIPDVDGAEACFSRIQNEDKEFFVCSISPYETYTEIEVINFRRLSDDHYHPIFASTKRPVPYTMIFTRFDHEDRLIARSQESMEDLALMFRPMLIPLNQYGDDISNLFAQENPNGSIVFGGTFCVDWQKVTCKSDPINYNQAEMIDVKDSDEHPLSWTVWNGRLYCNHNLACFPVKSLHHLISLGLYEN